jgi:hypothetical protein
MLRIFRDIEEIVDMARCEMIQMKSVYAHVGRLSLSPWTKGLRFGKPNEVIVGFSLLSETGIGHELLSKAFHGLLGILESPKTPTIGERAIGCPQCSAFTNGVPRPYLMEDGKGIHCWELASSNRASDDQLPCLSMLNGNIITLHVIAEV